MSTDLEPPRGSKFSAAVYDPMLWWGERSGMAERRRRLLAKARGSVLELGAGTGLNLPLYPAEGIERLVVTEPEPNMADRLERRAASLGGAVEVVQDVLRAGGFELADLEHSTWRRMPPLVHPLVAGRATPAPATGSAGR